MRAGTLGPPDNAPLEPVIIVSDAFFDRYVAQLVKRSVTVLDLSRISFRGTPVMRRERFDAYRSGRVVGQVYPVEAQPQAKLEFFEALADMEAGADSPLQPEAYRQLAREALLRTADPPVFLDRNGVNFIDQEAFPPVQPVAAIAQRKIAAKIPISAEVIASSRAPGPELRAVWLDEAADIEAKAGTWGAVERSQNAAWRSSVVILDDDPRTQTAIQAVMLAVQRGDVPPEAKFNERAFREWFTQQVRGLTEPTSGPDLAAGQWVDRARTDRYTTIPKAPTEIETPARRYFDA